MALFLFALNAAASRPADPITPAAIVAAPGATFAERLAPREVRRYVYLRTGRLLPIVADLASAGGPVIALGPKDSPVVRALLDDASVRAAVDSLAPEQYALRTFERDGRQVLLVAGGDAIGALYGAYRLAEHLGVRFYLEGDVVPDAPAGPAIAPVNETGKPLFAIRGTLPFTNFPEGSDLWDEDGYKAVLSQLPKLRMNFFNMHAHTLMKTQVGNTGPEPWVWVGAPDDVGPDGRVKFSYISRLYTTLLHTRNYMPTRTGDYYFGAAQLFERDDFGNVCMEGIAPEPDTPEEYDRVFECTGNLLRNAFTFARSLGVKTAMATQGPLSIPTPVRERLKAQGKDPNSPAVVREVYEGIFTRIMRTYPIDYYGLWTTEDWTWAPYGAPERQVKAVIDDFRLAVAAAEKVKAPFTLFTSGCTMGPPQDPTLFDRIMPKSSPLSGLNRGVGFSPVDPAFGRIHGRPKWIISWLEDDEAMTSPQLWVGRARKDAADALAYGAEGLIGIHWRTRVLGQTASALAAAAWDQRAWNPAVNPNLKVPEVHWPEGPEGGRRLKLRETPKIDDPEAPIYQAARSSDGVQTLKAYRLDVPNGAYSVTLKFAELQFDEPGRRKFSVTLQGRTVIESLDIFARVGKNAPLDFTFENVPVRDGRIVIGFDQQVGLACISGIVVKGPVTRKIRCGGDAWEDYHADWPDAPERPTQLGRYLESGDFYHDWARAQFGEEVAEAAAAIFTRMDGWMPRPSDWVDGPGRLRPDRRPWAEVAAEYGFVEELERIEPRVRGAGNRERFLYWLNTYRFMRANGRVNCTWGAYDAAMKKAMAEKDPAARKRLVREMALPLRRELVSQTAELMKHLFATISTTGEMGVMINWQNTILRRLLLEPGTELEKALGESLPADAQPTKEYVGEPRLVVPQVRTSLAAGEPLRLKAIVLGPAPREVALYWRPLGAGAFRKAPLRHVARGVYSVTMAGEPAAADLEYYVEAVTDQGATLRFPATAPQLNQSVVVAAGGQGR